MIDAAVVSRMQTEMARSEGAEQLYVCESGRRAWGPG